MESNYIYTTGYTQSYDDALLLLKWDHYGNLVWNTTWGDDEFPHGPAYGAYGTSLMGDANYIYTCGHSIIDYGPQYGQRRVLIKWDANPELLDINLISPAANSIYEGTVQVDIDITNEFVFLDVNFHWDDNAPAPWTEPYTTNLPPNQGVHTLYVNASTSTPYIYDLDSFTFTRDDVDPIIVIQSPTTNEVWDHAPAFDLDITELHIAQRWYTLNDGPNHYFYSDAGEIEDSAWNALPDGDVTIKFSVSDTLGHTGSALVVVRKDTQAEQREFEKMIRDAIIGVLISAGGGGAIGLGYFLIKRHIKKRDKKHESEKAS
jgi:hypothetical protein